jgi:CO/xanthine dehydrogenase Mo-binding subunit
MGEILKPPERLSLSGGKIVGGKSRSLSFTELMQKVFLSRAGEMIGRGAYQSIKSPKAALGSPTNFWEISWGGAEVEVDRDTGEIKLLKYVSLADVGKAIHPVLCEGQDEGGVMNAIGHSLLEEMIYKDGQLLNPNLVDYRVPSFDHLPKDFETILVESRAGLRFKGTGRALPVAAAIGNAAIRRPDYGCTISAHAGEGLARAAAKRDVDRVLARLGMAVLCG